MSPGERRELFVAMTTTLTQLHSIDWKVCGLEQYGGRGDYCSRQVCTNKILMGLPYKIFVIICKNISSVCKILQVSVWANNYEMASKETEKYSEMRELGDWLKTNTPPVSNQSLGNIESVLYSEVSLYSEVIVLVCG